MNTFVRLPHEKVEFIPQSDTLLMLRLTNGLDQKVFNVRFNTFEDMNVWVRNAFLECSLRGFAPIVGSR